MKKFLLLLAFAMLFTTNVDAQRKSHSSRRSSTTKTTTTKTAKSKTNKQAETPTIFNYADKWKDKAEAGDADAQFELAWCYYWNIGVKTSNTEAMEWALKAAEQGQPEAMELVGRLYRYDHRGITQDANKAQEWFKNAYSTAIEHPDDARALNALGILYDNGRGVEKNTTKAMEYYLKAAELNYSSAMSTVGYKYFNGEGVPIDYAEAYKWYSRAAKLGNAVAMNDLGWMYYKGLGVTQNYTEASKWFRKAAELGEPHAENNLALIDSYYLERDTYKNFAGVWRCTSSYTQFKFDSNGNGWFRNGSGRAWEPLRVTYKSYNCISVYDAHASHTLEISGSTMTQDNSYVYHKQ